jgi:hypothetical protein
MAGAGKGFSKIAGKIRIVLKKSSSEKHVKQLRNACRDLAILAQCSNSSNFSGKLIFRRDFSTDGSTVPNLIPDTDSMALGNPLIFPFWIPFCSLFCRPSFNPFLSALCHTPFFFSNGFLTDRVKL